MTLFLLFACADLPEGWEDARRIEGFEQKACEGDPYDDSITDQVTATPAGGGVGFVWENAHYRCAQDVEGFYRFDGPLLQVLVQPVDMHPTTVAGCDCLYRVGFSVDGAEDGWELWRRWDALNEPNAPELVARSE